ncbi:MAG: hypothetical protein BWY80_00351 [Firmicutes bacterium ADurb.Bin456]|nr:MAG: hypothetical protein BWY80_00351 [Firmicutes bacterium ADurb.Bin456]
MERYFNALKKTRGKLLSLPNVVGAGVGYKTVEAEDTGEPCFIIYVQKKLPPGDLSRKHIVPRKIGGLNTDVVESGVFRMLNVRTSRERPCQPGMSIGHYKSTAGTLGAVVKDRDTGELMVLSNNHVLANGSSVQEAKAKSGDPILQPGPYDGGGAGDRIGVLHRYVPLVKSVAQSSCPIAAAVARGGTRLLNLLVAGYEIRLYKHFKNDNLVDCALAKLDSPDLVLTSILEIGEVTGTAGTKPGEPVQKSGRTTGLTKGKVKSVGTTLQVEMKDNGTVWFSDQVVAEMISQPGDSGALILDQDKRAVGLLFAGSEKLTVFNRIGAVLDSLGVEL